MGRYEEAYTECQRALRLEPLSSAMQYALGCVYWMARRYDQAIEHLEKALDFEPNFSWSHGFIAFAYQGKRMYEPAVAAAQHAVELSPRSTLSLLVLAEAYGLAEKRDEAQEILNQVNNLSIELYVTPYFRARVYAALGEKANALDWLETSYSERMSHTAFLKVDPHFDSFRSELRLQDLLRRMKLV